MNVKSKIYMGLAVLAFLVVSLCILQPTQAQHTADGETVVYYVGSLSIVTPVNTMTYAPSQVCLNFTVNAHFDPNVADVTIVYSLDGKANATVPISFEFVPLWTDGITSPSRPSTLFSYYTIAGFAELGNLSQGSHSVTVFARYVDHGRGGAVYFDEKTIQFTIDENFAGAPEPQNSQATLLNNIDDKQTPYATPNSTTATTPQPPPSSNTQQSLIIFTPIAILLIGAIFLVIIGTVVALVVLLFFRRRQP